MKSQVTVIIATAYARTKVLLDQCVRSVFAQEGVDRREIQLVIVDDNPATAGQIPVIVSGLEQLRKEFAFDESEFVTKVIPNNRIKGNSGTGAWNTGIDHAMEVAPEGFVAILDDDDEFLPNHLCDCLEVLRREPSTIGVFQEIIWRNEDGTELRFPLDAESFLPSAFFIGNPGVQGSNLFLKTRDLIAAGAFDERFPSATDRDLMIRWLHYVARTYGADALGKQVLWIGTPGVIHHNHLGQKVTRNWAEKHCGLDLFYAMHKDRFSPEDYSLSLSRAAFLFNYQPQGDG